MNIGIVYAFTCYFLWGVFPVYWKALEHVPVDQILGHRMVWSFLTISLFLAVKKDWRWVLELKSKPSVVGWFAVISFVISGNWFVYTWAVTSGYIVEASLGYFINPLVNVLLGFTFLSERPRTAQLFAILLAFCGVTYLTYVHGSLPWVSLVLAFSFGVYALLKKSVPIGPVRGFGLETAFMFIPGLAYLLYVDGTGGAALGQVNTRTDILLVGAGAITMLPLVLFAAAVKHLTLTSLGIFQYIAPSFQFFIGVFVFDEHFDSSRLIGFLFVWSALVIFTVESLLHSRRNLRPVPMVE